MQSCRFFVFFCFFFSRSFHENFEILKNCQYDFHKILESHSTPKGAPACSKASKSYDWNVRNTAKISPKTAIFRLFLIFAKTKISTVILHDSRVLYVKFHQNRVTGIGSSRKEKDLSRLFTAYAALVYIDCILRSRDRLHELFKGSFISQKKTFQSSRYLKCFIAIRTSQNNCTVEFLIVSKF